ncbi:acetyltransferase [Burkholderiales bacterium JOSHI_001]|nr:acetyltransferase [Burkholderiales bacterium JOSHI_001]
MSSLMEIALVQPDSPALWDATRALMREYALGLGVDLCFQNFEAELASLPGEYAGPRGLLLLALVDGQAAACGAFRPLPDVDYANACEMKRLYVAPGYRQYGLGRQLAQALIDHAIEAGYSAMLLDTLDDMEAARGLYESLGFEEIAPYYFNPIPGAHYLKVDLRADHAPTAFRRTR